MKSPTCRLRPPRRSARAPEATVVASKNVWLDESGIGGSTPEQGKLLGGALVRVAKRDGDRLQLVLKGWQMEEAPSVVYQAKGHRVMSAVLADDAAATVVRGTAETDADTGQSWVPAEITLWSNVADLNTSRQALWDYSQSTYQKACAACHVLPQQTHFTANQWIGTLKAMKRFTSFTDDQYRLILAYLQNHSKDLGEGAGARAMTGTANTPAAEAHDLAFVAEWLAQQFLVAPDAERLEAMRSMQGQVALHWIGDTLDQQLAAEAICLELAGAPAARMSVELQRRHAALFGGIFRQRGAPPHASVWDGTGRLFGPAVERMQSAAARAGRASGA